MRVSSRRHPHPKMRIDKTPQGGRNLQFYREVCSRSVHNPVAHTATGETMILARKGPARGGALSGQEPLGGITMGGVCGE